MQRVEQLRPNREHLNSDLIAGLTFAVVNVPQAMAHALLATVNPVLGIYTLMVAVPVGAIFTGSVFMNVSTTSALSVATAAGLAEVPEFERGQALVVLVLLVGIIQLLAGLFRLGFLVRFVANSVMTGFLNGIAVLIILGQLGDLTGYESTFQNRVAQALDLILHPLQVDPQTTVIGLLTLGLIVLFLFTPLRKFAFILAIAIATVVTALLGWESVETVSDIAIIPRSLPDLVVPQFSLIPPMLLPALSIAIIGLIQGAGVSQGYPNPDGKYPDVSRDFLGQGIANLATSFVSGIPAGGSISGTALILSAGARSRWTNILSGLFVAVIVLVASGLIGYVPMAALAALLIVAGVQGLRIQPAVTVWNTGRVPGTVMAITFVATLLIPLQYAVLLGVAFSILLYVARQSNKVVIRQIVPVPGGFPEERPLPKEVPSNQITTLQVYGSLFFAAAKSMEELLPTVENTTNAVVMLGLRGRSEIGSTFVTVLQRYAAQLKARDSKLVLVGIGPEIETQLVKTRTMDILGRENVYLAHPQLGLALNEALVDAYRWLGQEPGPGLLAAQPPTQETT